MNRRQETPKSNKVFYIASALVLTGIAAIIALFTWVFFMYSETVEPGQELVLSDRPYFFGHEGVRPEPIKEGRVLLFKTTKTYPVVVVPQSIQIRFDDLSSSDNILLDFNSSIQLQVVDSVGVIREFGSHWFDHNLRNQYGTIVRQAVKKRSMSDTMSNVETADEIDNEVTREFSKFVNSSMKGYVKVINITLGRAQPNANVLKQMDATAEQQQRRKTLAEAEEAEKAREKEQIARAKADNAYRNEMKLDTAQFVALEQAKMYSAACAKSPNCIVTSGQGASILVGK